MAKRQFIQRDISWLSFNARVLQEANDPTVPLSARIRFLGIFSNNSDEFFRVRVATLKRMIEFSEKRRKLNMHLEIDPQTILDDIQTIVLKQQNEFNRIWESILKELKKEKIFLVDEKHLNRDQQNFVRKYFDEEVRTNIIPLMIESLPQLPYLREKSIYLGIVMSKDSSAYKQKYALIEVPARSNGRFVILPSKSGETQIILLEDIVRYNLPHIFSYFGFDHFESHIFKVTKDAEIDLDNDVSTSFVEKIEKGLKNRRKGKPVRFVYDKEMDAGLLEYLIRRLNLNRKSNIIPGGRIHNFRHFMDFPNIIKQTSTRRASFTHPELKSTMRVTDVILKKDVLLNFPYHSFNALIDLLREAAMDPDVNSIKITAYRLASHSKIINALINAARNGKEVVVMLELKARFDEEANLEWKKVLEEEGIKVLLGVPKMKIHAKLCIIKKRKGNTTVQYGFVSTGNLNESTSKVYSDHCLLTSNRNVMADINRIFRYLENWKAGTLPLQACKTLMVCPNNMRREIVANINNFNPSIKSTDFSVTIKSVFIHGNKSQVEFDYYNSKTQREFGDIIFISSLYRNGVKAFEKISFNQVKKGQIKFTLTAPSGTEQLYLLSRFPEFRGHCGLIPKKYYSLVDNTKTLGSYGLIYAPGDFAFISAKILADKIGQSKTFSIKDLFMEGNICQNQLMHYPRILDGNGILPIVHTKFYCSNIYEFMLHYLRLNIGDIIFDSVFSQSVNSEAKQLIDDIFKSLLRSNDSDIQSFAREYLGDSDQTSEFEAGGLRIIWAKTDIIEEKEINE